MRAEKGSGGGGGDAAAAVAGTKSRVVGLTGGIASGKSTVAARLRSQHSLPVIDCDALGHRAYLPGSACFARVVEAFGKECVGADGHIDRKVLGGKVFGRPDELKKLTDIVWAEIARLLEAELAALAAHPVVFVEAAVLFEAGWDAACSEVWAVVVDADVAVARLKQRNGLDEAAARARIASQLSNEERLARARIGLRNAGSIEELHQLVDACVAGLPAANSSL